MPNFNEGKVCDAIIQHLEERERQKRANIRWPEHENTTPAVEITFTLGNQLYAMEHTGIEPFAGHLRMEAQSGNLFGPITRALKDALGKEALFELYLPVNSLIALRPAKLQKIQNAIVAWVKATAPTIPKRPFPDYKGTAAGPAKIDDVPFELSLCRFEPPIIPDQYFQIKHTVNDLAKLRTDRMKAAIEKKFPKLAKWKKDGKAKTILVLEQNDIQLTNPSIVADTFLPLAQVRADKPDETYLLVSCMGPNWWVWPILIGNKSYFDIMRSSDEVGYCEFDPASLSSVTKK